MNIIKKILHNRKELSRISFSEDINTILILTGAGISAESGIETFRDANGLWNNHSIYEVARPEAIELTPEIFFNFQNMRAKEYFDKEPNNAHLSLKTLEEKFQVIIVTQNIDNLHEKAESTIVKHMHGKLYKVKCHKCEEEYVYEDDIFGEACTNCPTGLLRPDTVLFKERPKYLQDIFAFMDMADLFIQIGTSGTVYPAAGIAKDFKKLNKKSINISKEPPQNNGYFDYSLYGNATEFVPLLVDILFKSKGD